MSTRIAVVVLCTWVLSASLFSSPAGAATAEHLSWYQLWQRYYRAQRLHKSGVERSTLAQLLTREPHSARVWRARAYFLRAHGQNLAAAKAFDKARRYGKDSPHLRLATAYAWDMGGDKARAEQGFLSAMQTESASVYDRACRSAIYDAPWRRKRLPSPWFAKFYADPSYDHRINDFLTSAWLKGGVHVDSPVSWDLYGFLKLNTDSRSQGGAHPQIYNDNYWGAGWGVAWYPARGVQLAVQTGEDFDLLHGHRAGMRWDTTAELSIYRAWGAAIGCSYASQWPLRPFGDLYADATYYTRYHNAIGQVRVREGLRLWRYRSSQVSAYLKLNTLADSEGLFYNNVVEWGPGVSWTPNVRWPLQLRLSYVFGRYDRNVDQSPYGSHYTKLTLQALVYLEQ